MMSDVEDTGLSMITGAITGLPAPVRTSFFKALSDLLGGLTAIPAAKLKQYAQGIEDTTAARTAFAAAVAKAAADGGVAEPLVMQAAAEIYLPTGLRKAKNRIGIAERAAEHVASDTGDETKTAPPEDDWMNTFMRFAEDASSDKLQDLFGRILAGQVKRPGSFALSTLRAVSELDQAIAADFSFVWAKSVGEAVDYGAEYHRGEGFARWKRLAEAGLMAPSETAQFLPSFNPILNGSSLWGPMSADGTFLLIHFPEHCGARWVGIDFTRVGREIGSILARPDYEANMREAGLRLAPQGVNRVELHSLGKPVEIVYQASTTP
ncbi:DUF2806 domain-containing protein [Sphingomonas aurantiaca]|uniref:DUF2806 domain-containing protein n=1 Tax=Sphingomonas aurantiaca TaxID=185949 RepID=UPI002FE40930